MAVFRNGDTGGRDLVDSVQQSPMVILQDESFCAIQDLYTDSRINSREVNIDQGSHWLEKCVTMGWQKSNGSELDRLLWLLIFLYSLSF